MPNLIPQSIEEWMRRIEFKTNDLTRRMSTLIPGDIADSVNLDGFMSTGRWRRPSAVGTTTALGYPFNGASGTLEVYWEPTNAQVHQVFVNRGGGFFTRWWNGTTWSAWVGAANDGLPATVTTTVSGSQTISGGQADLPTNVAATLVVPAGQIEVLASVSCLGGSDVTFNPTAVGSLRYRLGGQLTFNPGINTAGIGAEQRPIANGGGTLSRVHTVTSASGGNLIITAVAGVNEGTGSVVFRDVTVQLTPLRRL